MNHEYRLLWRNKFLTLDAQTLDDMLDGLESAVTQLQEMRDVGVSLEGCAENDYALLVTSDPAIARKYGFWEWKED